MLVLKRNLGESILCEVNGTVILIVLVKLQGAGVHIGFDAPRNVAIHRQEVYDAIQADQQAERAAR